MKVFLIELSLEDVLEVHEVAIMKFGGLAGIRDLGLLESAVAQPFQSFAGQDVYPTVAEKAARYAFGIASNHPFVDGNKRTAAACMGAFLRINDITFRPDPSELLAIMLSVASGIMSFSELTEWVNRNLD